VRLLLIIIVCLAVGSATAATPDDIAELIKKLGSAEFEEREQATTELREIGTPARAALEQATRSGDPEIKMRAADVLVDIRYGIHPSWTEDLRLTVRAYDSLKTSDRQALVLRLASNYKQQALPFLMQRVESGEKQVANSAVSAIANMPDKESTWKAVLAGIAEPRNQYQADLIAQASEWSKSPEDITRALDSEHLAKSAKGRLLTLAQQIVRDQLDAGEYEAAATQAAAFLEAAPSEGKLLYCRGIALIELGAEKEGQELFKEALLLNDEAGHYSAGEMLLEMGRLRLSEKEWKRILEIPPVGDVYDLNAYMRLSTIYAKSGMYTLAADTLETGIEKYDEAKKSHGSSMGMIGGDRVAANLAALREKARVNDGVEKREVPAYVAKKSLTLSLTASVKEGNARDLAKEERVAAGRMTANVQPHGFRLFEKSNATISYDAHAGEIVVLLNNRPCTQGQAFVMKEDTAKIMVQNLDMSYIFLLDRETGSSQKLKSFERDYTLTVVPNSVVKAWTDVSIELNGEAHSWEELAEGVQFDYLPETMKLDVKGITPRGESDEVRESFDPRKLMDRMGRAQKATAVKVGIKAE
jgi:tetratricopeptide (TPR) repeat protein